MMPSRSILLAIFTFLAVCTGASRAATAPAVAPAATAGADPLDQKRIHADYNDGNFERVVASLERFMSTHKSYSLEDSIFIAKHLAVVYSANPETREKGKYYMYRLLAMLPSAKLVDMYVSDEIDRIFDKVREEFMTRQKSFGVDTAKVSLPTTSPARDAREASAATPAAPVPAATQRPKAEPANANGNKTAFLVAGGTALVALGVAAYFVFNDEPQKTEKTYVVP